MILPIRPIYSEWCHESRRMHLWISLRTCAPTLVSDEMLLHRDKIVVAVSVPRRTDLFCSDSESQHKKNHDVVRYSNGPDAIPHHFGTTVPELSHQDCSRSKKNLCCDLPERGRFLETAADILSERYVISGLFYGIGGWTL
jgi:hypothetical protein